MIYDRIDREFDARYFAGEAIAIELQLRDANDAVVGLGGRSFALNIYRPDRSIVTSAAGTILTDPDGDYAAFFITGATTESLIAQYGVQYQVAEDVGGTPRVYIDGGLSVRNSPVGGEPVAGVLPGGIPITRFVRTERGGRERIAVVEQGARGLSASQDLAQAGIIPDASALSLANYLLAAAGAGTLITPGSNFIATLASLYASVDPVRTRAAPGNYVWDAITPASNTALLDVTPPLGVAKEIDWAQTVWTVKWDPFDAARTFRTLTRVRGGTDIAITNFDHRMDPSPQVHGPIVSSTGTSVTIRPTELPQFMDAAYIIAHSADGKRILDRQFSEDGGKQLPYPLLPGGTRLVLTVGSNQITYTTVDANGAPMAHGLIEDQPIVLAGQRGLIGSDHRSLINGITYPARIASATSFKLKKPDGNSLTQGGGVTPAVPGAVVNGHWDGPVVWDGTVTAFPPTVVSPVLGVTRAEPVVVQLGPDVTVGHAAVQVPGGYVIPAGLGGLQIGGVSIVNGKTLVIKAQDGEKGEDGFWELWTDEDTPLDGRAATAWTSGGTISNIPIPDGLRVADRLLTIMVRKHGDGGFDLFDTLRPKITGVTEAAVSVFLSHSGCVDPTFEIGAPLRNGAMISHIAGLVIGNDARGTMRIPGIVAPGGGDDVLAIANRFWSHYILETDLSNKRIRFNFAPFGQPTARPRLPLDQYPAFEFYQAAMSTPFETRIVACDRATGWVLFADLPPWLTVSNAVDSPMVYAGGVADWDIDLLDGGPHSGRLAIFAGRNMRVRKFRSYGARKNAMRHSMPNSGAHSGNGSARGGLYIDDVELGLTSMLDSNTGVAGLLRRFDTDTGAPALARSDYPPLRFGRLAMRELGYGGFYSNWNMTVDTMILEQVGFLRTGSSQINARNDWTLQQASHVFGTIISQDRRLTVRVLAGSRLEIGRVIGEQGIDYVRDASATLIIEGVNITGTAGSL